MEIELYAVQRLAASPKIRGMKVDLKMRKPIRTRQHPKKCGNKRLTCESITLTDIQLNQEQKENKEKTMKKATLLSITGLLAIGLMFGVNFCPGPHGGQGPGTLDPSFGTGGTVTTNFGGVSVSPLTAIEQSSSGLTNGNIAVVAGLGNGVPGDENFALVRYTSNGTLIGTTTAAFFNDGINSPIAVAVQSNGNIVVAGTASGH